MLTLTGINIGFIVPMTKTVLLCDAEEATCPNRRVGKNNKCVQPTNDSQIHKDYVTSMFILKISTIL
jgi:hypothetical protein